MTCIVGLINKETNEIYMGGDSAAVGGSNISIRKDPKVFIKDNKFIIGFTSSFRMGQLLMTDDRFIIREQNTNEDDFHYMINAFIPAVQEVFNVGGFLKVKESVKEGGFFIVGYHKHLYKIECDFQVEENYDGYMATGCGEDLALGSLFTTENFTLTTEERITKALEAAAKFSAGVAAPFNIIKL